MAARIVDELVDHKKILRAADLIGPDGQVIAVGFYVIGLLWSNRHLTDGFLPTEVVRNFRQVRKPLSVADALVKAGLWDKNGSDGFQIHDFDQFNPSAADMKKKRRADRDRKAAERAGNR
jgi:hypothetical protein